VLASILQAVGLVTISIGLGLFIPALGIIAFGASVLVFGIAMERSN
jgi:hypothetical protein